jgi:hypothetical protein
MTVAKLEVRCHDSEKAAWAHRAGGARELSAWVRATLNAAAGAPAPPPPIVTQAVPPHSRKVPKSRERRPAVQLGSKPRSATCEHRRTPDQFCRHCDS